MQFNVDDFSFTIVPILGPYTTNCSTCDFFRMLFDDKEGVKIQNSTVLTAQ